MNLTISGHHLDVTPAIREYVQNKLERITRHFDQVIDSHVILCIDNLTEKEKRQKAEINLRVAGKIVHVASAAHDLYAGPVSRTHAVLAHQRGRKCGSRPWAAVVPDPANL